MKPDDRLSVRIKGKAAGVYARKYEDARNSMYLIAFLIASTTFGETIYSSDHSTTADRFKSFVASPPSIDALVYHKVLSPGLQKPRRQTVNGASRELQLYSPPMYVVQWQPNGFLHRAIASLAELQHCRITNDLVIALNNWYWVMDTGKRALVWQKTLKDSGPNMISSLIEDERLIDFAEVLNMGTMHLRPASIRWEGDHFTEISPLERHTKVKGELIFLSDGTPREMRLTYSEPAVLANYIVRYSFDTNLGAAGIPSSFTTYWIDGKQEVETLTTSISVLRLSTNGSASGFSNRLGIDVKPYLEANKPSITVYTNESFYSLDPSGGLHFISRAAKPLSVPTLSRAQAKQWSIVLLLTVNFVFLVLVVRTRVVNSETIHN